MIHDFPDLINSFIRAACVPRDAWHATGTTDRANVILGEHPEVANATIHTAAILGDAAAVQAFLEADSGLATTKGGPYGWDALTHLCFSNYLKLDASRSGGFVTAARALLEAGASAESGWLEGEHEPRPEWESVLYGAAGVAHHPELTALLLEYGADVNDGELVYHTPESYDNRALEVLLATGKLSEDSLELMLLRKHDWHDLEGARLLLRHGANPNAHRFHGLSPLHHALTRGNGVAMIELLLEHGADPSLAMRGHSAFAAAARLGRGDVLALLARRGQAARLEGVDRLVAACASGDSHEARQLATSAPGLVVDLHEMGGDLLARFAGSGNAAGVALLLDLGVNVAAPFTSGDGYFGIPKGSLAIHVAAWRGWPGVTGLLLERGSPADSPDPNGNTPLVLAVRATVDSYWTERRSTASIRLLLAAGASVEGIQVPTGYPEADELLGD